LELGERGEIVIPDLTAIEKLGSVAGKKAVRGAELLRAP